MTCEAKECDTCNERGCSKLTETPGCARWCTDQTCEVKECESCGRPGCSTKSLAPPGCAHWCTEETCASSECAQCGDALPACAKEAGAPNGAHMKRALPLSAPPVGQPCAPQRHRAQQSARAQTGATSSPARRWNGARCSARSLRRYIRGLLALPPFCMLACCRP
jgi:hypothetical protein